MSFVPARKSLQVWRGETFHYRFEWLAKSGAVTTPMDTTGWTATWTITPEGTSTPWHTFAFPPAEVKPSGINLSGETGLVDLILSEEDVESITWKQATFKVKVIDPITKEPWLLYTGRLTPATL